MRKIGEIFKEKRKEKKMTQTDVAKKLNVTKTYISYVESSKKEPTMEFLNRAADVFEMDVLEFFDNKIETSEELSREGLQWVIFGEEMKKQGVSMDQLKEWVRAIKATQRDK